MNWERTVGDAHCFPSAVEPQFAVCVHVCVCVCVAGLRQILTDVIEEVRQAVTQDIDGGEVVHSLLNAAWLQSLLKVSKHFLVLDFQHFMCQKSHFVFHASLSPFHPSILPLFIYSCFCLLANSNCFMTDRFF